MRRCVSAIAVAVALFHLYTAQFGLFDALVQRPIHLMGIMVLAFLTIPATSSRSKEEAKPSIIDCLFIVAAITSCVYLVSVYRELAYRAGYTTKLDILFGVILVVLILEMARRTIGLALPIIAAVFIGYAFLGPYMPGVLAHPGYSLERLISQVYLTTEGIWGTPLGVSANFLLLFFLFSAVLEKSGAGQFIIDVAHSVTGHMVGGPAKTAVFASAFFGTISGSSPANVATTGMFTIPMMKKTGFQPHFAGAVEAAASTGGQIMPPVMGAAAFIIPSYTGIPYHAIVKAAIIPAILYFLSIYMSVHFRAVKMGLMGLPREELPRTRDIFMKGWHYVIPIAILAYLILSGYSLHRSAYVSIIVAILVSALRKESRMSLRQILEALESGARGAITVAAAGACAGIVVAVVTLTGLGLRFSTLIATVAGNNLLLALFLTMVASIILGMGLPTSACYVILAALGAPALVRLGVPVLAAHFFVFYFGCLSAITPPVAIASYAGASIAEADFNRTGVAAVKIAIAAFIVPYMFVYSPSLLSIGSGGVIVYDALTAAIGVVALCAGTQRYLLRDTSLLESVLLVAAGLTLIKPGVATDIIGVILLVAVVLGQRFISPTKVEASYRLTTLEGRKYGKDRTAS